MPTMVHPNDNTVRSTQLLKQLTFLFIVCSSVTTFLYNQTIVETSYGVWLDHSNSLDGDNADFDTTSNDNNNVLRGIFSHNSTAYTKITGNNTFAWWKLWLDRIPPDHHQSPYILYVHVGKTGGIALEKGIPIRTITVIKILKCIVEHVRSNYNSLHEARRFCHDQFYNNFERNVAQLTRHIFAHKHLYSVNYQSSDLMGFAMDNLDTILVTTRNPIDRIVSAFNYHRNELIQNLIKGNNKEETERIRTAKIFDGSGLRVAFYNCFPDVRYFADELAHVFNLLNKTDTTFQSGDPIVYNQMTCSQLAFRLLSRNHPQKINDWAHYTSNYRWYKEQTIDKRPDVPVLVVRTEYLWQDAANIEISLGGNGSTSFIKHDHAASHGSENYAVTAKLETDTQRRALCCAMHDDLQAYQDIILGALNLSSDEKEEMIALVHKDCGVSVDGMIMSVSNTEFWKEWYTASCILRTEI